MSAATQNEFSKEISEWNETRIVTRADAWQQVKGEWREGRERGGQGEGVGGQSTKGTCQRSCGNYVNHLSSGLGVKAQDSYKTSDSPPSWKCFHKGLSESENRTFNCFRPQKRKLTELERTERKEHVLFLDAYANKTWLSQQGFVHAFFFFFLLFLFFRNQPKRPQGKNNTSGIHNYIRKKNRNKLQCD